jgi:hypothetical protein
MVKLSRRACAAILLVSWCTFLSSANFNSQYRSVEFDSSSAGDIILFIIVIVTGEIGKKLEKGARCPSYCETKHEHIYWENETVPTDSLEFFENYEKVLAYDG